MRTVLLYLCFLAGFMVTAAGCAGTSPRFTSSSGEAPPTRDLSVHQLSGIASYYAEEFDGRQTASGIYFYKLEAGSHIFKQKMVMLK